jgi:hypothetical protein
VEQWRRGEQWEIRAAELIASPDSHFFRAHSVYSVERRSVRRGQAWEQGDRRLLPPSSERW